MSEMLGLKPTEDDNKLCREFKSQYSELLFFASEEKTKTFANSIQEKYEAAFDKVKNK